MENITETSSEEATAFSQPEMAGVLELSKWKVTKTCVIINSENLLDGKVIALTIPEKELITFLSGWREEGNVTVWFLKIN